MSTRGWEMTDRLMPRAGFVGVEAAKAPPINACAVAVTTIQYTPFVNLIQMRCYVTLSKLNSRTK